MKESNALNQLFGPRVLLLSTLGLGVTIAALGATWSLWSAATPLTSVTLLAGGLDLGLGPLTWMPGDGGGGSTRAANATTERPITAPGSEVLLAQVLSTRILGDNTVADLTVRFTGTDLETDRVSAGYYLADSDGNRVAPAVGDVPLNMPLTLSGLRRSEPHGVTTWQVVVHIWDHGTLDAAARDWNPGTLEIELTQRRASAEGVWRDLRTVAFPLVTASASETDPSFNGLLSTEPPSAQAATSEPPDKPVSTPEPSGIPETAPEPSSPATPEPSNTSETTDPPEPLAEAESDSQETQ